MTSILNIITKSITLIANIGCGLPSAGFSYQPQKPSLIYDDNGSDETETKKLNYFA